MRRTVAVIGAGISGMGAAHKLAKTHNVTLFEAGHRLGGHARTVVAGKHGDQPVDTGFIVFNYANYPHLAALFDELDVPVVKRGLLAVSPPLPTLGMFCSVDAADRRRKGGQFLGRPID